MIFRCYTGTYLINPYEKIMKHTVYKCDTPNARNSRNILPE